MKNIALNEQEILYWDKVNQAEFITEPNCYKKCDSFCCRWDTPEMPFRIIPKGGTLFYMPKEYEYLKTYCKVPDVPPYSMSIRFSEDEPPLTVYYKHCRDDFSCNKAFSRSLYCKLYPFLPVFDIDGGGLIDVKYISVYDVAAECAGFETPCFVKSMKDKYMAIWQSGGGNIDLLREPYVLFHLMVASLLHDNYKDTLYKSSLLSLKGQEFWKKWEREYLRGSLINKDAFAKAIKELHGRFIKRYEITLS